MPYLWLIKIVGVLALLGGCWWAGDRHGHRVELQAQAEAVQAARENVAIINKAQAFKSEAADHVQELTRARQVRADAAVRSELDRLRSASAGSDLPRSVADPGLSAYAATVSGLLADCAEKYSGVAHDAGDSASRLGGLQSLVRPEAVTTESTP